MIVPLAAAVLLTGKMAAFNPLLGHTWSCASTVRIPKKPDQHVRMRITVDAQPQNSFSAYIAADGFAGTQYFGYDAKAGHYWANTANSDGSQLRQTSDDGVTFSGSIVGSPISIADTFAIDRNGIWKIHDVLTTPSGTNVTTDSVCTLSS